MSEFKEGDKVRVVRGPYVNKCKGRIGTIFDSLVPTIDFGSGFDGWGDGSKYWCVAEECLELITNTWAPKVGDKVRVTTTRHGKSQYGNEGVVSSITGSFLPISVQFDGCKNTYSADDIELVVDKPAFEVGQRVWLDGEIVQINGIHVTIADGDMAQLYSLADLRPATAAELAEYDEKAAIAETIERLKAHVTDPKYKIGEAVIIDDDDLVNTTGVVSGHLGYGMYNVAVVCNDDEIDDLEYEARFLKRVA